MTPSFLAGGGLPRVIYPTLPPIKQTLTPLRTTAPIKHRRCPRKACRKRFKPANDNVIHCSKACANLNRGRRSTSPRVPRVIDRRKCELPECQSMTSGDPSRRFCSRQCAGRSRRKYDIDVVCWCGNRFVARHANSESCSTRCKYILLMKLPDPSRVLRLREQGMNYTDIAQSLSVDRKTVSRTIARLVRDAA